MGFKPSLTDEVLAGNFDIEPCLRSPGPSWSAATKENILESHKDMELVIADNVAEYFFNEATVGKGEWNLVHDFPCIAPPWERFSIEWKRTKKRTDPRGNTISTSSDPHRIATFFTATDHDANQSPEARWTLTYLSFFQNERGEEPMGPGCSGKVEVDAQGKFLNRRWIILSSTSPASKEEVERIESVAPQTTSILLACFMTISFIHTKNVAIQENVAPMEHRQRWYSKTKKQLHKYKTLEIRPFQEQARRVAGDDNLSGVESVKKCLHLCRGHFKDYRGKGLFGRLKGIYWWDEFSRGDGDLGTVVKDYAVSTEHKEPVCGNVVQP